MKTAHRQPIHTTATNPARALFHRTASRIRRGETAAALSCLFRELDQLRAIQSPAEWRSTVALSAAHPLRELIHEDPMTRRAFEKPRGYAGDAGLLDFIYGMRDMSEISDLGMHAHRFCGGRSTIQAVRHRRDLLAHRIDRAADATDGSARVLAIACGHLREGEVSAAACSEFVGEIVGLDSDAGSLATAKANNGDCFTPAHMSVRRLIGGRVDLGAFDLVYSAGLYDYLDDRVALRLTKCLFDSLNPGGRLLLCNFLNTTPDVGFMETFMGWNLIYRGRTEIEALIGDCAADEIEGSRYFEDPYQSVGYLEVTKAGVAG